MPVDKLDEDKVTIDKITIDKNTIGKMKDCKQNHRVQIDYKQNDYS